MTAQYAAQYLVDKMPIYMNYLKEHFEEDDTMRTVNSEMNEAVFQKRIAFTTHAERLKNKEITSFKQNQDEKHEITKTYKDEITRIQTSPAYKTLEGMKNMAKAIILYRNTLQNVKKAIKKGSTTLKEFNTDQAIFDFSSKPTLNQETFNMYRDFLKTLPASKSYATRLASKKDLIKASIQGDGVKSEEMNEWISVFLKQEDSEDVQHLLLCEVSWLMKTYNIHEAKAKRGTKKKEKKVR